MALILKLESVCCRSLAEGLSRRLGLFVLVLMTCATAFAARCLGQCSFPQSSASGALTYAFHPAVTDGKVTVRISVEFQGGRKGAADLELPSEWAGQSHLESEVTNLKAVSSDTVILDTSRPNIKTLRFSPNHVVTLSYDLVKDWSGPFEYPKQFRAVLEPEFFEFTTQNALVHPKLSLTDDVSVHFDWTGLPAGWSLATSFGIEIRCQSFTGLWHKVNDALFAGGDFRLHQITVAGQLLVVAIRGKWPFTDDEAVERIQKIVAAERNFWHDNNFSLLLDHHRALRRTERQHRRQCVHQCVLAFTTQRVLRTAAKHLNGEAAHILSRLVEKGETIPVPNFPPSSCVSLTVDQIPSFDLGFDREILLAKNRVSDVNPESEAFKTGVRDGQEVVGMSIYWNDVSRPVRLKIRSVDGQQSIEYFPRGKTIPVPQYHLDEKAWASTPEECSFARN